MSHDGGSGDPSDAQSLRRYLSAVSSSSRVIPSDQDFHYYINFDEFRNPIRQIAAAAQSGLDSITASALLSSPPFPPDPDDAYDHVVDANDSFLERLDAAMSDLSSSSSHSSKSKSSATEEMEQDGFEVVLGKKNRKKKKSAEYATVGSDAPASASASADVRVATRDAAATKKPKVPFHIPTIPRPQDKLGIVVNNENEPFVHVWLERSEDGQRPIHPLESVSVLDFVDKDVMHIEAVKPLSLDSTPFKLVENDRDLKELAAKLRGVNEFAVDLEHNQYRSFQGLTCLIQISTRTEDFVIDALKLRVYIGPYLREVFKDPTKRKVIHGAERDIIWLQRDFGIYICNLFDTGQASRVLNMKRNTLEHLLHHFCGVTANKEYQNADWRLRPIPPEMLRYAREDTHYLLHIYDLMRKELFLMSKESESPNASLLEVYKRSYDICIQLYEKELLTEDSYRYMYGLQGAGLNAQQIAIVAGLFKWRDAEARKMDESTGYILPNKMLLELAKEMPDSTSKLLHYSNHPYIGRKLGDVWAVIKDSMVNGAAFEAAAESLKEGRVGKAHQNNLVANEEPEVDKAAIASPESVSPLKNFSRLAEVTGATVQMQKNPIRGLGALLGKKIPKKSINSCKQDKQEEKLDLIRASVQFPLHSFSGAAVEQLKPVEEAPVQVPISGSSLSNAKLDDVIMFQDGDSESRNGDFEMTEEDDKPMSPSELSSCFQRCFEERNRLKKLIEEEKNHGLSTTPFDYEAARKQTVFGHEKLKGNDAERNFHDSKCNKKSERASKDDDGDDDEANEFSQGRRRKAFPASGNRSASFR